MKTERSFNIYFLKELIHNNFFFLKKSLKKIFSNFSFRPFKIYSLSQINFLMLLSFFKKYVLNKFSTIAHHILMLSETTHKVHHIHILSTARSTTKLSKKSFNLTVIWVTTSISLHSCSTSK